MSFLTRSVPPLVLVVLAAGQFLAAGYARLTGHGQPIEKIADRVESLRPPETPAGYAFSIWFVIFALSVAYAVYYWAKGRNTVLCRMLSLPSALLFTASILWMVSAQTIGDGWHLVFLIMLMWGLSVHSLTLCRFSEGDKALRQRLLLPLFGLYAGWLSVALPLNLTGTIARSFGTFGLSADLYALFTLIPAALIAIGLQMRLRGEVWSFLAVLWALIAVIAAQLMAGAPLITPLITLCFGLIGLLAVFFARGRRHDALAAK